MIYYDIFNSIFELECIIQCQLKIICVFIGNKLKIIK